MKKALLFLFSMLTVMSASALSEVVAKLGDEFSKGHLAYIYTNVRGVKENISEGNGVYSEMDEALCNYYEAMLSIYIFEDVDNKSEKLDLSNRILGENHYMTLSMKAVYNKSEKNAITDFDKALLAIENEVGIDSWQYLSVFSEKAEALANLTGKMKDTANLIKKEQKKFVGTTHENHWTNACLHGLKSVLFSNAGKYNEMEEGMNIAYNIMNDIVKDIDNKRRSPLAYGAVARINLYLAFVLRAHDELEIAMSMSELGLAQLIEMGLGETGLAYCYRSNIAEVYYKRGEYDKSRPMMIEYLQYLSTRNDKNSENMYNHIKAILDKTPVK